MTCVVVVVIATAVIVVMMRCELLLKMEVGFPLAQLFNGKLIDEFGGECDEALLIAAGRAIVAGLLSEQKELLLEVCC